MDGPWCQYAKQNKRTNNLSVEFLKQQQWKTKFGDAGNEQIAGCQRRGWVVGEKG